MTNDTHNMRKRSRPATSLVENKIPFHRNYPALLDASPKIIGSRIESPSAIPWLIILGSTHCERFEREEREYDKIPAEGMHNVQEAAASLKYFFEVRHW